MEIHVEYIYTHGGFPDGVWSVDIKYSLGITHIGYRLLKDEAIDLALKVDKEFTMYQGGKLYID